MLLTITTGSKVKNQQSRINICMLLNNMSLHTLRKKAEVQKRWQIHYVEQPRCFNIKYIHYFNKNKINLKIKV
jgi:hypothetical protein